MDRLMTPGLKFFVDYPDPNELHVVCQDGSIQSCYRPDHQIDWIIEEEPDGFYYRATPSQPRKPCTVRYHSRVENPPAGRPQNAEITEQKDEDPEVTSKLAKIDPLLAYCTAIVNDPVQTDAMVNFAEGKLSYAEMRALCG